MPWSFRVLTHSFNRWFSSLIVMGCLLELSFARAESIALNVTVPAAPGIGNLSILTSTSAILGNGVVLNQPPGVALVNTGSGVVRLGHDVRLGNLVAGGNVEVGDRVVLNGNLTAVGNVVPRMPQVDGISTFPASLSNSALNLAFWAPQGSSNVVVPHDAQSTAAPGGYGSIEVKDRGKLNLSPGTYAVNTLSVGWSSQLRVNTSSGPLILVVRQGMTFNGSIVETGGSGRVLIVYVGTAPLRVESALSASVLAPSAALQLKEAHTAPGHTGQFWAQQIELGNHSRHTSRAFTDWNTLRAIQPTVACVVPAKPLPNGGFSQGQAVFGYQNPRGAAVNIPSGPRNSVTVSDGSLTVPVQNFLASGQSRAFVTALPRGGTATWALEGISAVATESSPRCTVPDMTRSGPQRVPDLPDDYNPSLPDTEPPSFDGVGAYYSQTFEVPAGWREQLGLLALQDLAPPPGSPIFLPYQLSAEFSFSNDSYLDDGLQRDHLLVLIDVNGERVGSVDCERHAHCEDDVDLGTVSPGLFDVARPWLASMTLTVQFRRCPLFDDCYWRTIGEIDTVVELTRGFETTTQVNSDFCSGGACDFFIPAVELGQTTVRFEDLDGFNDIFSVSWWTESTPPTPPPPAPPSVPGMPEGLCVQWNTSFVEDLLYLPLESSKYPAAFAEYYLVVKNGMGQTLALGKENAASPASPTFLNEHGCIPYSDELGQPTELYSALTTPVGSSLPEIDLRVATRFQKPAGMGATTFDVFRHDFYKLVADTAVNPALGTVLGDDDPTTRTNLVLAFRTDNQAAPLSRDGYTTDGTHLLPPSPWILGRDANPTLHPMTEAAAIVSQALRTAAPNQFRANTAHRVEVGPGCPGGSDQAESHEETVCVTQSDCTSASAPWCDVVSGTCGCTLHSQCGPGLICALPAAGAVLGQCIVNQGDSCASSDPISLERTLFVGPSVLPRNFVACDVNTPCPGHQVCLHRTPSRRFSDMPTDDALHWGDPNPLVINLTPCEDGESCQCHLPPQSNWKFVIGHELGHHVQDVAGVSFNRQGYTFGCPYDPNNPDRCPAIGAQSRDLDGRLFDPPFAPAACGCDHVVEANRLHCLQSLELTPSAVIEGFAQFYASTLFNDVSGDASGGDDSTVDPCTFVYYKGLRDAQGQVHPAPVPVSCDAQDRWRNNFCPMDPDAGTERDWMQFLWSWHTTALNDDLGDMFTIFRAGCGCSINATDRSVTCEAPPGCVADPTSGLITCDSSANCQPGSTNCEAPVDCNGKHVMFWDWPSDPHLTATLNAGETPVSIREGVIWRYSGGLTSTQVDPNNFPEYTEFEGLSRTRGVNREMDLK